MRFKQSNQHGADEKEKVKSKCHRGNDQFKKLSRERQKSQERKSLRDEHNKWQRVSGRGRRDKG